MTNERLQEKRARQAVSLIEGMLERWRVQDEQKIQAQRPRPDAWRLYPEPLFFPSVAELVVGNQRLDEVYQHLSRPKPVPGSRGMTYPVRKGE
jgi:hypothetical protein